MFDITLRPLKDGLFEPLCPSIPPAITPLQITATAFLTGLASCYYSAQDQRPPALFLWIANRALDCLDGALARHRKQTSDLGGFLDLLGDFIVYSLIPIACAWPALTDCCVTQMEADAAKWLALAVAFVEASFHVNNFVLFYAAAILEKQKASAAANDKVADGKVKELTSVMMRPALIEGAESGAIFTLMIALPNVTVWWCWLLAGLVAVGILQRVWWLSGALA